MFVVNDAYGSDESDYESDIERGVTKGKDSWFDASTIASMSSDSEVDTTPEPVPRLGVLPPGMKRLPPGLSLPSPWRCNTNLRGASPLVARHNMLPPGTLQAPPGLSLLPPGIALPLAAEATTLPFGAVTPPP